MRKWRKLLCRVFWHRYFADYSMTLTEWGSREPKFPVVRCRNCGDKLDVAPAIFQPYEAQAVMMFTESNTILDGLKCEKILP